MNTTDEKFDRMLELLNDTNKISQNISIELSQQSEIFDRIEKNLDKIDQNLSISERIINRMASFFSFFSSKNHEQEKIIEKSDCVSDNGSKHNEINNGIISTINNDKFDEILNCLKQIKSQSISHGEILDDHNKRSGAMIFQIEKNQHDIKKISSTMRKI